VLSSDVLYLYVITLRDGKHKKITYSDYVFVALCIQLARRMRRIVLSHVARLAVTYFSTLSHKQHKFRRKNLFKENVCYNFLCSFDWDISHYKKNWARSYHKSTYFSMSSTRYSCQIWIKL